MSMPVNNWRHIGENLKMCSSVSSKGRYFIGVILLSLLWSFSTYAQSQSQQISIDETLYDIAWNSDGSLLAVASVSGVTLYDSALEQIEYLESDLGAVSQVTWHPSGNQLVMIGFNMAAFEIWDRDANTSLFSLSLNLEVAHEYISAIAWSPDGEKLAVLVNDHVAFNPDIIGHIEIWDSSTRTLLTTIDRRLRYAPPMLVWDSTSTMITSGSDACYDPEQCSDMPTLETFDVVTEDRLQNTAIGPYPPQSLVWSPGENIAVSTFTVEVYTASGERLYESEPYNGLQVQLSWNGDGSLLAALDAYGHLAVIDVSDGEVVHTSDTIQEVVALDWNGATNLLAIASENGLIEIMNTTTLLEGIPSATP